MSTQPQDHGILSGLSMFNGQSQQNSNPNSDEKASNQALPPKNTPIIPHASSPSNVKLVGSNRFVVFQSLTQIFC